jgi:hypothetical protein
MDVAQLFKGRKSMSNDISTILYKLAQIESTPVKSAISEAKISPAAPKLPALFKPKKITPVLGSKEKQHPTHAYFVGDDVEVGQTPLEEAMKSVEEEVIDKVRNDLTSYLDALANQQTVDQELKDKAKSSVQDANTAVPGEQRMADESSLGKIGGALTKSVGGAITGAAIGDELTDQAHSPVVDSKSSLIKRIAMEDGTSCDIHGNEADGFEIRRGDRRLPTIFREIDDAETAIQLWKGHRARRGQTDSNQDYVDER